MSCAPSPSRSRISSVAEWTEEQRAEVARVLEAYALDVAKGEDGPRDLDAALDAIWSTVSQDVG
jgi:hypothetical protein